MAPPRRRRDHGPHLTLREAAMKHLCHTLLAGMFAIASVACSSTNPGSTSGSSSAGASASGNNSGAWPPPTNGKASSGGVIDDRVNRNPDLPGTNH
jgi:hypothetical protein